MGISVGTAAAVLLVGGIGTAAYADDVSSTVSLALASLGVEASEELVDDLAGEELLDDALVEDLSDGDDLAEEVVDDEESIAGEEAEDSGDENLEESFLAWNERAELWRTAFAEVKDEFDACRAEAEGGSGDCAVTFSGRLQVAFAETLVEFLESQSAAIAALPEDERAAAQAKLDKRLDRALEKLDRTQERVADRDAARLERALTKLERGSGDDQGEGASLETDSTGTPEKPGKPDKPGTTDQPGKLDKLENPNGGGNGGGKPDHAGKPGER